MQRNVLKIDSPLQSYLDISIFSYEFCITTSLRVVTSNEKMCTYSLEKKDTWIPQIGATTPSIQRCCAQLTASNLKFKFRKSSFDFCSWFQGCLGWVLRARRVLGNPRRPCPQPRTQQHRRRMLPPRDHRARMDAHPRLPAHAVYLQPR